MQEDMIWPTDTVPKLLCEPPLFAGSRDESLIAAQVRGEVRGSQDLLRGQLRKWHF
jgi:hypothetical protein